MLPSPASMLSSSVSPASCTIRPQPAVRQYCTPAMFTRAPGTGVYNTLSMSYGSSIPK